MYQVHWDNLDSNGLDNSIQYGDKEMLRIHIYDVYTQAPANETGDAAICAGMPSMLQNFTGQAKDIYWHNLL